MYDLIWFKLFKFHSCKYLIYVPLNLHIPVYFFNCILIHFSVFLWIAFSSISALFLFVHLCSLRCVFGGLREFYVVNDALNTGKSCIILTLQHVANLNYSLNYIFQTHVTLKWLGCFILQFLIWQSLCKIKECSQALEKNPSHYAAPLKDKLIEKRW